VAKRKTKKELAEALMKRKEEKMTKSVSEILGENQVRGTTPAIEVLNKELLIKSYSLAQGSFGEYALIEVENDKGEQFVISCGGKVVLRKLRRLGELNAFPCFGTFKRVGRYYDLV